MSNYTQNIPFNQKFGRWLIVGPHITLKGITYWKCICDCETIRDVRAESLISGKSKSCACLRRENLIKRTTKHKLSKHPLYKTVKNAKYRCENPNSDAYADYGERGIKFNFASIAEAIYWIEANLGPRPSVDHT